MGRLARVVVPALPHHVTQRGNRRLPTFFQETDYRLYLKYKGARHDTLSTSAGNLECGRYYRFV